MPLSLACIDGHRAMRASRLEHSTLYKKSGERGRCQLMGSDKGREGPFFFFGIFWFFFLLIKLLQQVANADGWVVFIVIFINFLPRP